VRLKKILRRKNDAASSGCSSLCIVGVLVRLAIAGWPYSYRCVSPAFAFPTQGSES